VIIATLLGGNPTNNNTANITTNIIVNGNGTNQNETPTTNFLQLPLSFHNLFPGHATTSTVTQTLGNPAKTAHAGDYTIEYFVAKGTYRYNIIVLKQDIVQYIIEQTPTLPALFTQYKKQTKKKEDGILYDANDDGSGVNLYTFAQNGVAFADNPDTDQTNQVHYFIPQTYQTFLLSEGVYLSFLAPPTN
jgi:hypothetical protein